MAVPARDYSEDDLLALGQAVLSLLDDWGLQDEQEAVMLGLSASNSAGLQAIRDGRPLPYDEDVLERANRFLHLSLILSALYQGESGSLKGWMLKDNAELGGHKPFDFIREYGVTGLAWLEDHLQQQATRQDEPELFFEAVS